MTLSLWSLGSLEYLLSVASFLLALLLSGLLLKERRAPGATIAWLLVILLVPYVGVPLYLLLGGRKVERMAAKKDELYFPVDYQDTPPGVERVERILMTSGAQGKRGGNRTVLLKTGEEAFEEILGLIRGAERRICITTFIFGRDEVGRQIIEALAERAREGVEVRLLLDALGSFWVRGSILRPLREAGGKVAYFMPMFRIPVLNKGYANLRNHRKILIADGRSAIIGGRNLAKDYIGPVPDPGRRDDLSILIAGPAAGEIEKIFKSDWKFAAKEELSFVDVPSPAPEPGNSLLQVFASGPDVPGDTLYDATLSGIFNAVRRIWVATPYFVPDESLTRGLELAARRGIDLRIIVPERSDNLLADMARGSYLRQIEEAGGKVELYPGSLHAKAILVDELWAVIGSANMDMRSLLLNYEVGVFMYSEPDIRELAEWFVSLRAKSEIGLPEAGWGGEFVEGVGRILSPML